MACTIDHLHIDQPVTVLRDFTDLAGHTLRAGDQGVIRGLGLDMARMEIWMELEQDGTRTPLRFALAASDGPRNGRMRDYFGVAEPEYPDPEIQPPPSPAPTPSPSHPPPTYTPRRPETSFHAHTGKQAPDDTSLAETRVACDCDPAFHRELVSARSELTVAACLACGTVTCTRSFGDDGRFTGDAWQENRTVALPDPVHRWISGWPRVKVDYTAHARWPMGADFVRYPTLYYPADSCCTRLDQLAPLEARLTREQAGQSVATRLRTTHRVKSPPPADLLNNPSHPLRGYVLLWQALQLNPASDLADLLHHAQPRSPGSPIAAELIARRADALEILLQALDSPDPTRQGIGFLIAREMPAPHLATAAPRLAPALIQLLETLSLAPLAEVPGAIADRGKGELLLLTLAELKLSTPDILTPLSTWMRKISRHDGFLADCARTVLRELDTHPGPSPNSSP